MTSASAHRLAQGISAVTAAVAVAALVFLFLSWREPLPPGSFGFRGFTLLFVATFGSVGALIASRHPDNPIGWIFCVGALLSAVQELAQDYALYAVSRPGTPLAVEAAWIPAWIWVPGTGILVFVLLLFPNGRVVSPGWRWVTWIGAIAIGLGTVGLALSPGPLESFETLTNPFGVEALGFLGRNGEGGLALYGAVLILAAASIVVRFRRSSGDEREQLKWLVASGVLVTVVLTASLIGEVFVTDATAYLWMSVAVIMAFLSTPIAIGIAVLKHRLYDIDIVISKALVYGLLAIFITLVYVGVVVGVGTAVGSRGDPVLSAFTAAIVALAFQPARRRAQHLANRLVYGRRATPYEVLSELSSRFAGTYSLEDALPRLARVTAEAVGADRTRVWLRTGDELQPASSWPSGETGDPVPLAGDDVPAISERETAFPVRHRGELLGAISVTMPSNELLTPAQGKLLTDVAAQAGLVLRNVALLADLRASRKRIVAAQDDRARSLERNIHDGAQQQLVALAVKLRLAEQAARADGEKAARVLADLQQDATDALENLRDLAKGIYPPLLADKGLAAALDAHARKSPVPVSLRTDGIARYPQEVEAAVYFCVLEALQNVSKYANASDVRIALGEANGDLSFSVQDDGVGFDPAVPRGSGLTNIRDRVEALGGELLVHSAPGTGTTVTGRVPVSRRSDAG